MTQDVFGSDIVCRKIDDENYEASVKVSVGPQFFGWIVAMNGKVEIRDEKIKKMMADSVKKFKYE